MADTNATTADRSMTTFPVFTLPSWAETSYGDTRRRHNEIVRALRDCGIEKVFRLPKIVVIGNQSAGKSSLLEAISGIKVPRASGTCTRCPMEVVLVTGPESEWHAKVSLRFEHVEVEGQKHTNSVDFGQTRTVDEVPILLRRAQLAILNPDQDPSSFQSLSDAECDDTSLKLMFSRNTVVIQIKGAETDITFIDLPGIIAGTAKEEESCLVLLIKDMVKYYVSQKESLILLTTSMKDDMNNQSAYCIAKDYDNHGVRTFGVLTKADRVEEGDEKEWLEIFDNKKSWSLHRGWYMTRLADTAHRDQPREVTLRNEFQFFQNELPWAALDKNRMGTLALREALGSALSHMIEETLPTLKEEIVKKLKIVDKDLNQLPESFQDNPQSRLLNLCSAFLTSVNKYTSGEPGKVIFLGDARPVYSAFEREIRDTRPKFTIDQVSAVSERAGSTSASPSPSISDTLAPDRPTADPAGNDSISLDAVKKCISEMRTRELYGICPFAVHEHYIAKFTSCWQNICTRHFEDIQTILKERIDEICNLHFGRFTSSGLHYDVTRVVNSVLDKISKRTQDALTQYCNMENHRPFTMSEKSYLEAKNNNFYSLAIKRAPGRDLKVDDNNFTIPDGHGETVTVRNTEKFLLDILAIYGIQVSSAKKVLRIHEDEFEAELEVMAHVVTYFDIASNHLIDNIPKIFETIYAKGFALELGKNLNTDLNLVGEGSLANCARFVKDDPEIEARRIELERQRAILNSAISTVDEFFK